MNKMLIAVAVIASLVACSQYVTSSPSTLNINDTIQRTNPDQFGVVCYIYTPSWQSAGNPTNMDCVQVQPSARDLAEQVSFK